MYISEYFFKTPPVFKKAQYLPTVEEEITGQSVNNCNNYIRQQNFLKISSPHFQSVLYQCKDYHELLMTWRI